MAYPAIQAKDLSKQYRVGAHVKRRLTFREMISESAGRFIRNSRGPSDDSTFWALKDLSFEIQRGEVVGIVGRNGAGKSTLLKVLSRITRPTTGYVELRGRVGSLLEVGTGFHSELTGRENVYLSGAILGMKKTEIARKFDEIVDFSGIGKFLDTAVKFYSSGMYMRLAFAVAAHLDPEILFVDEVLAVGDLEFQKKCLGKMGQIAETGRTVIFISHQMNQIRRLCNRGIWMDRGRIMQMGDTAPVVSAYETAMTSGGAVASLDREHVSGRFFKWGLSVAGRDTSNILDEILSPLRVSFWISLKRPIRHGVHGIALYNSENLLVWGNCANNLSIDSGTHVMSHSIPVLPLRPGTYQWKVSLYDDGALVDEMFGIPPMLVATPPVTHSDDNWQGVLNIPSQFAVERE